MDLKLRRKQIYAARLSQLPRILLTFEQSNIVHGTNSIKPCAED